MGTCQKILGFPWTCMFNIEDWSVKWDFSGISMGFQWDFNGIFWDLNGISSSVMTHN